MIASTIRRCDGGSAVSPSLVSFQGYALAERVWTAGQNMAGGEVDADQLQPGRVDDLYRENHQSQRYPQARRPDGAARDPPPARPSNPFAVSRAIS
jgi:hypothetical protein